MLDKRFIFALIALVLGYLGIQEFVLGHDTRAVFALVFFWTGIPAIIALVQIVKALCAGSDERFFEIYPNCKL